MSYTYPWTPTHGLSTDQDQKRAALNYLNEAWAEARHDGVDGDCLAQASLFAAFAELVSTYGEDAVAKADTIATQWVPGVNALGTYGRWAFAEFRSAHDLEADFDKLIQGLVATSTTPLTA